MPEDPGDFRELPLDEAARVLGLKPATLQKRLQRGEHSGRKDNRGRWLVRVPASGNFPDIPRTIQENSEKLPGAVQDEIAGLRIELARLEERLAAANRIEAGLQRRVDELAVELQREREEHRAEASDLRAERDRLLGIFEALAAERRQSEPSRRPWPGLKAWIRRVWEGKG